MVSRVRWDAALDHPPGWQPQGKRGPKPVDPSSSQDRLYSEIGQLKMELDWLKKKVGEQLLAVRKTWIGVHKHIPLTRQCELAGVARSTVYAPPQAATHDALTLILLFAIDAEYTRHPFYGSRRMVVFLVKLGYCVNRGSDSTCRQVRWRSGPTPWWPRNTWRPRGRPGGRGDAHKRPRKAEGTPIKL